MGQKLIPQNLNEALRFLNEYNCKIVAGGSDIMLQKKNVAGSLPRFEEDVLFISNLDELNYERLEEDGLHIGATKNMESILENDLTPDILKDCLRELASTNIRHFATLTGNIANASPAGDSVVVDVALDAKIKISCVNGVRYEEVNDFIKGVRKIDLNKNEMIEEIIFPIKKYNRYIWYKVGSRKAESISKVSFAATYNINNDIIDDISIAFGSVFIKTVRSKEIEDEIKGLTIKEFKNKKDYFIDKYKTIISPITDQRSTKEYRNQVAINILEMVFNKIINEERR